MRKLFLLILLSVCSFSAIHAEMTWKLSQTGTLTISGTEMPDYEALDDVPWFFDRDNVKKVVIENGVTYIGRDAFIGCRYLTYVSIPNSVTRIGEKAFAGCSSLVSITIPESVTSLGAYAFSHCSGLTAITIPNSVTSIGDYAFANCNSLTSFTFPNSVTSVGNYVFDGCPNLISITIPESVTSLGDVMFKGHCSIESITNYATTPQVVVDAHTLPEYKYTILHVLPGYKAIYEADSYWQAFTIVEDAGTTGIDDVEGPATISEDKIFSISGRRLDKAAKGVNIINGKKVLAK